MSVGKSIRRSPWVLLVYCVALGHLVLGPAVAREMSFPNSYQLAQADAQTAPPSLSFVSAFSSADDVGGPSHPVLNRTLDIIAEPTNWSGELLLYLQEYDSTAAAAQTHDEVGKAARDLVPDDVGKVFAGVFQITRNRKGHLAITRRAA